MDNEQTIHVHEGAAGTHEVIHTMGMQRASPPQAEFHY